MAITVTTTPANLSWSDFTSTTSKILDPADGTMVDAYTAFNFNIPSLPPKAYGSHFGFADPMTITITPRAQVWSAVSQTAALLSHEEWHYNVGTVTARVLAKRLARVRRNTIPELITYLQNAVRLHFFTRTGLLQQRYDMDTKHGTVAKYQKIWKDRMTTCLADPNATQLGGFYL